MPQVQEHEIEPCEGVPKAKPCLDRSPLRLQGFDDKWRCPQCHRIHTELVFSETKQKDAVIY